jgi:predicted nucleic acid-binding protein
VALIFDTGPLVALLDTSDPDHERCAAFAAATRERRLIPVCVLVEVEYMLRPWPRAFAGLLVDIDRGAFELLDLPKRWLLRAGDLVERYRDSSLGLVDATVIAATEMLDEPKLATLDRRHFGAVRPCHCEALRLLPDE